jgi:hypothetical protein
MSERKEREMKTKKIRLELELDEVNMILEAIGALPFARVYTLVGHIQEQARPQIEAQPAGPNGRDHHEDELDGGVVG